MSSSFGSGIVAALAAPLLMTIGFIIWDNHWTGSPFALNLYKCNLATIGFLVVSWLTRRFTAAEASADNSPGPFSAQVFEFQSMGYLMLSSVIGIIVGDLSWLEGLKLLGAKRVIIMDSLKPFLAAMFGWIFLEETLHVGAFGGIFLTVLGILLVSLEDDNDETEEEEEKQQTAEEVPDDKKRKEQQQQQEPELAMKATTTKENTDEAASSTNLTVATALADPSSSTLSLAYGSFPSPPAASDDDDPSSAAVVTDFVVAEAAKAAAEDNPTTGKESTTSQADDKREDSVSSSADTMQQQLEKPPPPTTSSSQEDHQLAATTDSASRDQQQPIITTNVNKRARTRKQLVWGYILSIINIVLDTYGSVLTKQYGTKYTTWEINLIRFGFAGFVMTIGSIVLMTRDQILLSMMILANNDNNNKQEGDNDEEQGKVKTSSHLHHNNTDKSPSEVEQEETDLTNFTSFDTTESNAIVVETTTSSSAPPSNFSNKWYQLPLKTMTRGAWIHVSLGVLFVTFLTPALSNYALFQIALALALTLGSVGPLYALPLTYWMERRQQARAKNEETQNKKTKPPSLRAWLGSVLAVAGIVVLAFVGGMSDE